MASRKRVTCFEFTLNSDTKKPEREDVNVKQSEYAPTPTRPSQALACKSFYNVSRVSRKDKVNNSKSGSQLISPQRSVRAHFTDSNLRRSPRLAKRYHRPTPYSRPAVLSPHTCQEESPVNIAGPSNTLTSECEEKWQLSKVVELSGCRTKCARFLHSLSEYDVLILHSAFCSKTYSQQRQWLLDYFHNHCPTDDDGEKDLKNLQYIVSGRKVCQPVWVATLSLSLSTSRFYTIRSEFLEGKGIVTSEKRSRSYAPKSLCAIACYFERIGDKRPDTQGLYLPTCLTEKAIYNRMVEGLSVCSICQHQQC